MKDLITKLLDLLQAFLNKQAGSPEPAQPSQPASPQPTPVQPSQPKAQFVSSNTAQLSEADYQNAANLLGAEVAAVKAVASVESSGKGFLASGRPAILFESQHFGKATGHKYDASHPNISTSKWDKSTYKGGEKEYDRLFEAMALDETAALSSASWGLFQILGSNYHACGYNNVQDFVNANVESQGKQLECFVNFLKANRLDQHLRDKNWDLLARGYNGPQYQMNNYQVKLKEAYDKFSK